MRFARRLEGVSESATLKLNALVQELKKKGEDVVNLTAGEPDCPPPPEVKQAAIHAIETNQNRYTPVPGLPELRELVAAYTTAQQPGIAAPWKAASVVVSNGGKQAIFDALQALVDSGDEVLIPAPYWLSYPEMVKLAGGVPRVLQTKPEAQWKLDAMTLAQALDHATGRPRVFIINSPSNPTGILYTKDELAALGRVLGEHPKARDLWIITDEIYDSITFDGRPFCSFLGANPGLALRTITVNGLSKRAAITGWRVGWTVCAPELAQAIQTVQGQSTSGINAPAQWAAIAALKLPADLFRAQAQVYERRRNLALEILARHPKLEVVKPEGAFYAFLGVGRALQNSEDSLGFCERLLQGAKVAAVPGTPFGAPAHLRISFALDDVSLRKGCERIVDFLG